MTPYIADYKAHKILQSFLRIFLPIFSFFSFWRDSKKKIFLLFLLSLGWPTHFYFISFLLFSFLRILFLLFHSTFSHFSAFCAFLLFCLRLTRNSKYDRKFPQIGGFTLLFLPFNTTKRRRNGKAKFSSAIFAMKGQQRSFRLFKSRSLCNKQALLHTTPYSN